MTRQIVATDRLAPALGPFSAAVTANGMLYSSGQVALDPATAQLVAGGVADQTSQVLRNIACVLEAAGCSLADVIKANVYLADMSDFDAMNAAYERHFEAPFPARTTIQAARLPLGALVEIEAIACLPPPAS
jgi:2-iminobutanoate/2-iminopropanoate deaminase